MGKKQIAIIATAAVVVALIVGIFIGRSGQPQTPDQSADGSHAADISGTPDQSADVSAADKAGRIWAEGLVQSMQEGGLETMALPADTPTPGNDDLLGQHLERSYTVSPHVNVGIYTDPDDASVLRVNLFLSNGGDTDTLTAGSHAMAYIVRYFSGSNATQIQLDLELLTAPEGEIKTVTAAAGTYTYMTLDDGYCLDFVAS